jgi:CubicO group peptidase (beta-lactamase class C family)
MKRFLIPFALSAVTIGPVAQSAAYAAEKTASVANKQAIATLEKLMVERRIPGAQIAVVRQGKIVLSQSFGIANVEHQVPVTSQTLFPINSATKSFTGIAAVQLVEDGLLDLDAPISTYLDDLPESWRAIKVRQLLAHSSGLPNIIDGNGLIGAGGEDEAWALVKTLPLDSPAGSKFAYNQTNYALLAKIIAKLGKMPFPDFFAERQFKPAGMKLTRMGDTFDVMDRTASAYSYYRAVRGKGEVEGPALGRWIDELPSFMRTGAGINTTADELAGWIIALQTRKLLKKDRSLTLLWTADRFADGNENIWAMGWPIIRKTPHRIVGGIGGGRSAFFVYPDDDLAIVVLTNLVGAQPQSFMDNIAEAYVPGIVPAADK